MKPIVYWCSPKDLLTCLDILMKPHIEQARLVIGESNKRDREEYMRAYAAIKIYIKAGRNLNGASSWDISSQF